MNIRNCAFSNNQFSSAYYSSILQIFLITSNLFLLKKKCEYFWIPFPLMQDNPQPKHDKRDTLHCIKDK